jgi:D-alanyl-D-alanine carboxypeptidase/D-alanyl-D-alanine-endopeptidase (penicillin-binding protein 4)
LSLASAPCAAYPVGKLVRRHTADDRGSTSMALMWGRRWRLSTLLVASASLCAAHVRAPALAQEILAILSRPDLRGTHWGIEVRNATAPVYMRNADSFFIPASNKKLLASAAALLTHGPGYRFHTPLLVDEDSAAVLFCGAADPSLRQAALEGAARPISAQVAAMLRTGDVRVVAVPPPGFEPDADPGSSSVDSWEYGDLTEDYGAQPAAFVVDALLESNATALGERMPNSMRVRFTPGAEIGAEAAMSFGAPVEGLFSSLFWTVHSNVTTGPASSTPTLHYWYPLDDTKGVRFAGSVPLRSSSKHSVRIAAMDPTTRAEGLLAAALADSAVTAGDTMGHQVLPAGPEQRPTILTAHMRQRCDDARAGTSGPSASIYSEDLLAILNHTLQESDNTYAELICRMQGLHATPSDGSYASSFEAIARALDTIGINRTDYVQADGSGLSRHNLITPSAIVHLLQSMRTSDAMSAARLRSPSAWEQLLPLAGRSGTLSSRFVGTPLEGVLRAKTGTLGGVSALSGYVRGCTFSMMVNNAPVPSEILRRGLDDIALAFGLHPDCN